MKFFVTSEFKKGVKKLIKDHNKRALASLKKAINTLCEYEHKNVTFNNNHDLVNTLYNEMHIGGFGSDILFVWKYDNGSNSIVVTLQGRDLTNHSDIKKKNYKEETEYEEFDINKLQDSLRLVWIFTSDGLKNMNYKDYLNSKYNDDEIIHIINKIKDLTSFINSLNFEHINFQKNKIKNELSNRIDEIEDDIKNEYNKIENSSDQKIFNLKILKINNYISSLNETLKSKYNSISNESFKSFLLILIDELKLLMKEVSKNSVTVSSLLNKEVSKLCEEYMNKYSSEDISWIIEYDGYEIEIRLESYSLNDDDFTFVSTIEIEEGDNIEDIEVAIKEEMNSLLDDFKYELETSSDDLLNKIEDSRP